MSARAFDTHKAVTALKQAGFEEALGGNVATKADLAVVQAKLEADIAPVRPEMAAQFTALYKQLWLMAGGGVGLTVTLVAG